GQLVLEMRGLTLRHVAADSACDIDEHLFELGWIPRPLEDDAIHDVARLAARPEFVGSLAAAAEGAVAPAERNEAEARTRLLFPRLNRLCSEYIVAALRKLGLDSAAAAPIAEVELAERLGVHRTHRRLFGRLNAILGED